MRRFQDWPMRLAAYIEKSRPLRFQWGRQDCCLWACDWVLEATGIDIAASFRGTYDDMQGAAAAMKRYCGGGLPELVEKMAAEHPTVIEVRPRLAQRGDVVLVDALMPSGVTAPTLGIVGPNGRPLVMGRDGMIEMPIRAILRAWR